MSHVSLCTLRRLLLTLSCLLASIDSIATSNAFNWQRLQEILERLAGLNWAVTSRNGSCDSRLGLEDRHKLARATRDPSFLQPLVSRAGHAVTAARRVQSGEAQVPNVDYIVVYIVAMLLSNPGYFLHSQCDLVLTIGLIIARQVGFYILKEHVCTK